MPAPVKDMQTKAVLAQLLKHYDKIVRWIEGNEIACDSGLNSCMIYRPMVDRTCDDESYPCD